MKNAYVRTILLLIIILISSCKQTNEPNEQNHSKSIITETGNESPFDFIGTIDVTDWDPDIYKYFTIEEKYWIDKSTKDTIKIIGAPYHDNVKIHNLSDEVLQIKISVTPPFRCSEDTVKLFAYQTEKVNITIDTINYIQDNVVLGLLNINLSSNPPIHYILRWDKPKSSGGIEVSLPKRDILYPAYPNPADGSFTFSFDIKSNKHVTLKVLNDRSKTVSLLINDNLEPGGYRYTWLTTQQESDSLPSGLYKVVLETDGYYCSGDILFQK